MTKRFDLVCWYIVQFIRLLWQFNGNFWNIITNKWRSRGRRRMEQKQWIQFHEICITHSMHHFWYRAIPFMMPSHICTHHLQASRPIEMNATFFRNEMNNIQVQLYTHRMEILPFLIKSNKCLLIVCAFWHACRFHCIVHTSDSMHCN